MEITAARLRDFALTLAEGALLGSEDEIVEKLGVSRVTVRQAARLLEREGLVRVRRGLNGGYFAARPSFEMVESVVCAYLDTLGLKAHHTGNVASALWIEIVREAATAADRKKAHELGMRLSEQVENISIDATSEDIAHFERESRAAIFDLIDGTYVELLFQINAAFARQQSAGNAAQPNPAELKKFIKAWKKAKFLGFQAIADGDPLLAIMAALHESRLWIERGSVAWTSAEDPR